MKKTIKKEEDRVILDVSLSVDEMRSGKTVLFTVYDAQNFLKNEGYNITTCVENKSAINVGLNANDRGKFVFLLKEKKKPKSVKKSAPVTKTVTTTPEKVFAPTLSKNTESEPAKQPEKTTRTTKKSTRRTNKKTVKSTNG
tara:strand:- start:368 stop:790 length:423 start_codon:yes stop_codon:yes gene_type:complete